MTTLIFVGLAQGSREAGYRARVPDLPGVTAEGADLALLLANARESVLKALQALTDQGGDWPAPTPLEAIPAQAGATPFLVDVAVDDQPVRVNISIGERLLKRIDQAAEARGMSRSGFIAEASKAALGEKGFGGDFESVARKLQDEWSVLGRKITDSLGPDSSFNRSMTDFDQRLTETIRKAAENVSSAMSRRKGEREAGKPEPDPAAQV